MSETFARELHAAISQSLLGKPEAVHCAVITLLAGGHLLIEDRPGVGKTLLARSLARCLDLPFQRVQCTADMLPADLLGGLVYDPKSGQLNFRRGPIFTSVLVADELNRTPPRTQSALLESMQEQCVTIERQTHALPDPFFVVATQNPLQFSGTYPLPESQLDRFLMRIRIGYPDAEHELEIVAREDGHAAIPDLPVVANADDLRAARAAVREVHVERELVAYMVELARRTRNTPEVRLGVSTRGAQALHRACRARAWLQDREYVVPDDVRAMAVPVFAHRMTARGGEAAAEAMLTEILTHVASPD